MTNSCGSVRSLRRLGVKELSVISLRWQFYLHRKYKTWSDALESHWCSQCQALICDLPADSYSSVFIWIKTYRNLFEMEMEHLSLADIVCHWNKNEHLARSDIWNWVMITSGVGEWNLKLDSEQTQTWKLLWNKRGRLWHCPCWGRHNRRIFKFHIILGLKNDTLHL